MSAHTKKACPERICGERTCTEHSRSSRTSRRGFTLIELLVAISIIGILSVIGLTRYSSAQENAREAATLVTLDDIYKQITWARMSQNKTLFEITGRNNSETVCLGKDALLCLFVMRTSYAKVTSTPLPMDSWGRPYVWDENEGEFGATDCRHDIITSAGPDTIRGNSDDISFIVPFSSLSGCQ